MRDLFKGVLTMTALAMGSAIADTQDEAAIKTIVESVATLADTGNFEALETLYAEEVVVDYTSLTGGEVELKSPQALMSDWARVLPGFDRTRHQISNVQVEVSSTSAIATADVIADHYVNDLHWQVSGDYRYELASNGERWTINAMTLNLRDEQGTRDVFGPAMERAEANPPSYIRRQQTVDTVHAFLTSLEDKDMEAFSGLWTEDAVQDMPYSPKGHPKRVSGKQEIVALYADWPNNAGDADLTSQLVFYPMRDPQMVFAEFKGKVDVVPTGREYRQTYGGLFHVVDGKIALFREYYDPAPFAWAFGLEE